MNLAIDLPDDVLVLVNNLPDQRSFLIEAIRREWQRRKALAQLNRLSEQRNVAVINVTIRFIRQGLQ